MDDLLSFRIAALQKLNVYSDRQREAINVVIDALKAHNNGPDAYDGFVEEINNSDISFKEISLELWKLPQKQPEGVGSALDYAKAIVKHEKYPRVLECSIYGDNRFSAACARVSINNEEKSIEEWCQSSKRNANGLPVSKGETFDHIIDPFTNTKMQVKDAHDLCRGLWITYLIDNPDLVDYASGFDEFTDYFYDPYAKEYHKAIYDADWSNEKAKFFSYHNDYFPGAAVIGAYVKGNRQFYVDVVKASHWYKNVVNYKKTLAERIFDAEGQKSPVVSTQDKRAVELQI